jgi:hypothetical protein
MRSHIVGCKCGRVRVENGMLEREEQAKRESKVFRGNAMVPATSEANKKVLLLNNVTID